MIAVLDVLTRLGIVLNDDQHIRWPVEELIAWLNEAAAALVVIRPQAHAVTELLTLEAGARQSLPADSIQLLDVIANEDGTPVDRTSRYALDSQVPGWRAPENQADSVRHFTFDELNPTEFYVYPPAKAGTKVETLFSSPPPEVTESSDSLQLDRVYIGPLVSYCLYRALSKDSEYASGQLAAAHYQAFASVLMGHNQADMAVTPNQGEA